jgi:hypothetical protein
MFTQPSIHQTRSLAHDISPTKRQAFVAHQAPTLLDTFHSLLLLIKYTY